MDNTMIGRGKEIPRYAQTKASRFLAVYREKGLAYIIHFLFNHICSYPIYFFYRAFVRKEFNFNGASLPYFFHFDNHTWLNERVIEVPIIYDVVRQYQKRNRRILEVGNVLSHYFPVGHDVVDKYETAEGIINEDISEFSAPYPYDLIVSISTLEHVGWDEIPRQPEKIFITIDRLKAMLSKNGELYVTLPIGENAYLDKCLREGSLTFARQYNFMRVGKTEWRQAEWEQIRLAQHNKPFRFGNAVIVGIIQV